MPRRVRSTYLLLTFSLLLLAACERSNQTARPTPQFEPGTTPQQDTNQMNDASSETTPEQTPPKTSAVEQDHYVFVGQPKYFSKLDCEIFDTPQAPHRRPSMGGLHDATDYPERFGTSIDILDVLKGTGPMRAPTLGSEDAGTQGQSSVAFALGLGAFREGSDKGEHGEYNRRWCERINAIMSSPYVVIHAYVVHVDRGNSAYDEFQETWGSLGTDPRKGNRGFQTREEAFSYAKSLVKGPSAN